MNWKRMVRLSLLGCVVATLAWLVGRDSNNHRSAEAALPDALQGQPDLYMLNAEITQYSESGHIKYTLDSSHVRHFEHDGITRLQDPELLLLAELEPAQNSVSQGIDPNKQSPWQIVADQGFIRREPDPDGNIEEVVFLRSNVQLRQRLPNGRFLTLKSPSLYLYPDRQFAQSNDSVMIDTEGGRTTGTGLAVNLAASTLNVYSKAPSRVQTIILPDQFK